MWRAYWRLVLVTMQQMAAYPFRLWGYLVTRVITLFSYVVVWHLIYQTHGDVGGYNFKSLFTYYALAMIITELTLVWRVIEQFTEMIRLGQLSTWLLKPVGITLALFSESFSFRLIRAFLPTVLVIIFMNWGQGVLSVERTTQGGWFLLSVSLSITLAQFLYGLVGLSAFWVVQTNGIKQIFARVAEVFAGTMFPLDFLPQGLVSAMNWLPFQSIHFVPISIYLGKLSGDEMRIKIGVQFIWLVVVAGLYVWTWNKGIRRYESVGN